MATSILDDYAAVGVPPQHVDGIQPHPTSGLGATTPEMYGLPENPTDLSTTPAHQSLAASPTSSPQKRNASRKRDSSTFLRKAPQAPKRFKSSYICFFMAKQAEIKEILGDGSSVTDVSRRSAELWKVLTAEERAHWDEEASKDKQRYLSEKASYTGPWQIPYKRVKKDPSAPKRPMSAFLFFTQGLRQKIKKEHPEMKNTEVSRLLGDLWRKSSEEEKKPHVDKEREQREKYKVAMAQWREESTAKAAAEEKLQAEKAAKWQAEQQLQQQQQKQQQQQHSQAVQQQMPSPTHTTLQQETEGGRSQPSYDPIIPYSPQGMYGLPPGYPVYHPPPPGYYSPYPPPPYHYPVNGKQPVILGPNGLPHYQQVPQISTQGGYALPPAPPQQHGVNDTSHQNAPSQPGQSEQEPASNNIAGCSEQINPEPQAAL